MRNALTSLDLPQFPRIVSGKVREVFDLRSEHGDRLLFVATDRVSAFDSILPTGIPCKGAVLNNLSRFWFERLSGIVPNHMVSTSLDDLPVSLRDHANDLAGRFMIVEKLEMIQVECVVRGYLAGSGHKDYLRTGAVCGIELPPGLEMAQRLDEPIFTPAAKNHEGHDENISFERMAELIGRELSTRLRRISIELYQAAAAHAAERGVIIADTKFEFGLNPKGEIVLGDEALTPDSSRYWPRSSYQIGVSPPSYDKQFVRDHLSDSGWSKEPPAPPLPEPVVRETMMKYLQCYEAIVGQPLALP